MTRPATCSATSARSRPVRRTRFLTLAAFIGLVPACSSTPLGPSLEGSAPPGVPDRSRSWVTPAVQAPGVQRVVFESSTVGGAVSYHVFLPEGYEAEAGRRFPVLYWLHGTGGGLGGIGPVSAHFAAGMAAGEIPPFLVVFPNGMAESMWTNAKDGRVPMETVVVRDVVDHVDATFRTLARREGRLLEGFSMGGRGAGRLGFRFPEVFGSVSMLGAGPLDPDFMGPRARANPAERARIFSSVWGRDLAYYRADGPAAIATLQQDLLRGEGRLRLRIVVGALDPMLPDNRDLHAHLTSLGLPHAFEAVPGVGHQALPLLTGLEAGGWAFYRAAFAGDDG